jgi:protein-disulfide isomerase
MSILNSRNKDNSLIKPIAIIVVILLVIGGIYTFFSSKDQKENSEEKKEETIINSSGLDEDMDIDDVADVEKVIAKWIEANPQAIIASVTNMQKKAVEQQIQDAQKNISAKKDELFNDKNSPTFSPSEADVEIVEFFDYQCGYCKKAHASVNDLLASDKKVKIIYKEYPILGETSFQISQVSIAVNIIDPSSYKKFHDAIMKSNVKNQNDAINLAKSVGISADKLKKTLESEKDKIQKILQSNATLGASIGINGTPGFVIGEELIPGAVDTATLKEKINAVRNKK